MIWGIAWWGINIYLVCGNRTVLFRTEKSPEHPLNLLRDSRIKQDSSLRTNSTWQVDKYTVFLQTKYIIIRWNCTWDHNALGVGGAIQNSSKYMYKHVCEIPVFFTSHFKCGRLLATTAADQTVKVWKTSDFTLVTTLTDPVQRWVWDCAFSSDSLYIVTGLFSFS